VYDDGAMTARLLGTMHAAAVVVGSMIGTGIFTTTGMLLPELGAPVLVLVVWAVAGVLALCGAAVYAELGVMMPRVGGEYVYLSRAYGPAMGFLSGWVALIVGFAAPTAAGAIGFATYVHAVAPALPEKPMAVGVVVLLTAVHMASVRFGARLQSALSAAVVVFIVLFIAAAFTVGDGDWGHLTAAAATARAVGAGGGAVVAAGVAVSLVQVSYAYSGWNGAAYIAGEVRDPARALPRAVLLSTGLVTALYVALNLVFLYASPAADLIGRRDVAHVAAVALFGQRSATLLSSLVALTSAGFVSAMLMSGPRVSVAMAQDGVFFRALGRTNARGAPTLAVGLQGALAVIAVLTATFDSILVYVGFALTLNAAAAVAGAFVLRRREPAADRPYRTPLWPLPGVLFLVLAAFMTVFAARERPKETGAAGATLVAGGLAYDLWRRRGRRSPVARTPKS
jgi:APA family basic amino acid/polyamine antiporter